MVRTQPRPSLRAGARWDQGPLTSALRQADPARVVGNKSSATALGDFQSRPSPGATTCICRHSAAHTGNGARFVRWGTR